MADDRIVYPDEVDDVKNKAASQPGVENNSIEESSAQSEPSGVTMRNMITVPGNCPPGFKLGADGVCREVWD